MSLEKQEVIDKIDVLENGILQVRKATRIIEDDKVISMAYDRWTLTPGQDVTDQTQQVQDIAAVVWTPEVIQAYKDYLASLPNDGPTP